MDDLFFDWSSLTTRSQKNEFCVFLVVDVAGCWVLWCLANGYLGKKLKLAARARVESISRICLKIAGHACRFMVIDEPHELSMVSLPGVDFFWKGRLIVNTFVLEPKAPSSDMVSHEGCEAIRDDEAGSATVLFGVCVRDD